MEVDFDKQIDTILRDLAKGNALAESPPASHLDADELSAFAENVLPPKARLRAMEHLTDCSHCRKILSAFVSLNADAESETVHEEVKNVAAITPIPWYRQLFAFPQLSYLMGALALVLTGAIGLILYQNSQNSPNDVAMTEPAAERAKGPSGMSSEANAANSGLFAVNSANTSANAASPMMANANSAATNSVANTSVSSNKTESNATASGPKPMAVPTVVSEGTSSAGSTAKDDEKPIESERAKKTSKEETVASKGGETNQPTTEATPTPNAGQSRSDDNVIAQQRVETQNRAQNQIYAPDGETKRSAPPSPPPAGKRPEPRERDADIARKKVEPKPTPAPAVFKDVAGKSFRSVGGVWTDTAYKGGSTISVRRGTDQYKKLDSGLRSTADYLGGTVIIAWKGKNYKIQ